MLMLYLKLVIMDNLDYKWCYKVEEKLFQEMIEVLVNMSNLELM